MHSGQGRFLLATLILGLHLAGSPAAGLTQPLQARGPRSGQSHEFAVGGATAAAIHRGFPGSFSDRGRLVPGPLLPRPFFPRPLFPRPLFSGHLFSGLNLAPSSTVSLQEMDPTDPVPTGSLSLQEMDPATPVPTGSLVAAGTLGAFLGFLGGGALGALLDYGSSAGRPADQREFSGVLGFVVGGMVGSAVAVPAAVHLANDRRGDFFHSLGGSALVGAVGALSLAAGPAAFVVVPLAPLGMIAASVRIERATSR